MKDLSPAEEAFLFDMLVRTIEKMPARHIYAFLGMCVSRLEELGEWTCGVESKVIESLIPDTEMEKEEFRQ